MRVELADVSELRCIHSLLEYQLILLAKFLDIGVRTADQSADCHG